MRLTQSNLIENALIADVANIAQSGTYNTGSNINEIYIGGSDYVDIQMKVTGEAAANGVVTFNWLLTNDNTSYPTVASFQSVITMTSNTITKEGKQYFIGGYKYMKLLSITNGDAAKDATAVNALVSSIG